MQSYEDVFLNGNCSSKLPVETLVKLVMELVFRKAASPAILAVNYLTQIIHGF